MAKSPGKTFSSKLIILSLAFGSMAINFSLFAQDGAPTKESIQNKFPNLRDDSECKPDGRILCPFLRIMERASRSNNDEVSSTDCEIENTNKFLSISQIMNLSPQLGLSKSKAALVAVLTSMGQVSHFGNLLSGNSKFGHVNLTDLPSARGLAHKGGGFGFSFDGKEVNKEVIDKTVSRLKELGDENGNATLDHLKQVKNEICNKQEVTPSLAGKIETGLIFKYLGGAKNGTVNCAEVDTLLNGKVPNRNGADNI